ncbi:hypothetical protein [Streptodolium elevatio]|uniref:Uncharacterized protein n=1 Tax=Streptodolium elevatio TaxID=3157996 RepID=A0ABV3DXI4_9ACTN
MVLRAPQLDDLVPGQVLQCRDRVVDAHLPVGTLKVGELAGKRYVMRCGAGPGRSVDWINTGRTDFEGHTVRDPASDLTVHKGDHGNFSRVKAALTGQVGWAGDFQKLTATFEAVPQFWNELLWEDEGHEGIVTALSVTLTLTGPDGAVISSEPIAERQTGTRARIRYTFTRTFTGLPVGECRLTVSGVKTGGWRTRVGGKDTGRVVINEHAVTCTIGSP